MAIGDVDRVAVGCRGGGVEPHGIWEQHCPLGGDGHCEDPPDTVLPHLRHPQEPEAQVPTSPTTRVSAARQRPIY
eukprot:1182719-Prorocentrum_minimum.AAC.6